MDILGKCLADVLPLIQAERIVQDILELGRIEQRTDFGSFAESATYMQQRFRSAGIESQILAFPADGVTKLQCWTTPIGYRTTRAVCAIVEPRAHARLLGDREVEPNTAIVGTGHTGPQGIEAQVIHITERASIAGTDIADKIVYCSNLHPISIRPQVVEGHGKAIVSSYTKHREMNYNHVHWVNTWDSQSDGWLPTAGAREENLPGISISPEMGDHLERCLAQGPVTLRIVTEGEYYESEFLGVTATVRGQENRAVLLTGHLFEQGLTDNAAGAMVGLWVSRVIRQLAERPDAPPLRRGLTNFHSQECYGALALREYYPEIPSKAVAHLNIDMVGAAEPPVGLLPGLLASAGLSGFLMRLILERAREHVPTRRWELGKKFDINCTLLADPLLGGIPTTQLEQLNPAWHTSRDRGGVLELDRETIRFVALAATTWAYFLVSAGDEEAEWLLRAYKDDVQKTLRSGNPADTEIYVSLMQREMSSIAALVSTERRGCFFDDIGTFIADVGARQAGSTIVPRGNTQETERSKRLYPKALLGGPAVDACFTEAQLEDIGRPKWSSEQLVLKSWADGTRSIYDIARLATYETGAQLSLEYVLTFFENYADQGIVSL